MHKQSEVAQETPYRFDTVAELAAPTTLRAQPRRHRRLAAARQPLGRHLAGAAQVDRARGQRPRLPRPAAGALPQGARPGARTSSPSTSTARGTCSTLWSDNDRPDHHRPRRPPARVHRRRRAGHARGLHPGALARRSQPVRDRAGEPRGRRVRRRRRRGAVHDPVDLQAVRLRAGARGARPGRGRRARRDRAERRAVQRDQPRARHRAPREPDDQRRGDPHDLAGRRRLRADRERACRRSPGARSRSTRRSSSPSAAPATATARSRT